MVIYVHQTFRAANNFVLWREVIFFLSTTAFVLINAVFIPRQLTINSLSMWIPSSRFLNLLQLSASGGGQEAELALVERHNKLIKLVRAGIWTGCYRYVHKERSQSSNKADEPCHHRCSCAHIFADIFLCIALMLPLGCLHMVLCIHDHVFATVTNCNRNEA